MDHDFVPEQVWGRDVCQARVPDDRHGVRVCNLPRRAHGVLERLIAACVWCAQFCACQWRCAWCNRYVQAAFWLAAL